LKALIDYLVLYRAAENAEIILEKGVYICDNYTNKIEESKHNLFQFDTTTSKSPKRKLSPFGLLKMNFT